MSELPGVFDATTMYSEITADSEVTRMDTAPDASVMISGRMEGPRGKDVYHFKARGTRDGVSTLVGFSIPADTLEDLID